MSYTNSAGPDQLPRFESSDLDRSAMFAYLLPESVWNARP